MSVWSGFCEYNRSEMGWQDVCLSKYYVLIRAKYLLLGIPFVRILG